MLLAGGEPTDPYFDDVVLLLHLNGSNGSTTFPDSSINPKTVSANGNAQISTAQSKFGGASVVLDGTGDYLTSNDNADFEFGSGDFTIEFWMRLTSSARQGLISKGAPGDWASFDISTDGTGSQSIQVRCSNGSGWSIDFFTSPVPTWSLNTWHYVALVRNGNTFTLYIDGTDRGSGTASISLMNNSSALLIGRSNFWSADAAGNIDEVRITKGVARYTSNFTAPDAPFPDQ
jgi:hypothetical protein